MFCERCGRLRNRATGRCVCDDDPTLATPIEGEATSAAAAPTAALNGNGATATLVAPALGRAVATPPGLAPLPQQIASLNGARPVETPVTAAVDVPLGRIRAVLPDFRAGLKRVDLRIHEDALVIDEVPGLDPVLVGRIAGGLLLGPLGFLLGDGLGRRRAKKQRLARLSTPRQEETGERLRIDQLVAVTVQRQPWGGTVRLGAGGSGSRTLRWSKLDLDANDVAGQLQAVATRRFSMHGASNLVRIAHRAGVALIVLLTLATVILPAKAIFFPPPAPGADLPAAARDSLGQACPAWRTAPLEGAGLASIAASVRPHFESAAAAAPEFATLGADIALVEAFAPKAGTPTAPLAEAAQFGASVANIDAACARVGL